ncbi:CLUMA_CG018112, isoform A [Clunio marinus]|uniref:CLUMA_CG018112, isoform A n=1 Tax=Clunio marinus TaxID=568069 RepID=A0A1J1J127_9DIPT|nr:CLUMA_CG018112, isoform A [Clunio marinus]
MPTTTMALSSPLNPSTLTVTSQSSTLKDETVAISPQLTVQHDLTTSETAQLSSPNADDVEDIKANVNGNNVRNGGALTLLTAEHGSPKMSLHSPITIGTASLTTDIDVDLNMKSNDISCLNVATSPSPTGANSTNHFLNGSNGHLMMSQSGGGGGATLNFQAANSPESPWSIGEVENSGFVNFPTTNNGQMHKRPIMSQQPHHGLSASSSQGLSPNPNSPSKYRRSTSYPGKNQNNMHGFQMDAVGGIIEDQSYMSYQDRNMDMRSLEHCLNDITNTGGVQSDLKGEFIVGFILIAFVTTIRID